MKKLVILLMLLSVCCASFAQNSSSRKADSLLYRIRTSNADTNRVQLLLELGRFYVLKHGEQKSDLDTAILLAHQAEVLSKSLLYQKGLGCSYSILSQSLREKGDTAPAIFYVEKAIPLLKTSATKPELAEALKERCSCFPPWPAAIKEKIFYEEQIVKLYRETGNKRKYADELVYLVDLRRDSLSIPRLLEALHIYQSIGYKELQSVYSMLGSIYSGREAYDQALKYGLLAVKTSEELKDSTISLCTVYNWVGATYYDLEQYNEAADFYAKSLQVAYRFKEIETIHMVGFSLVSSLLDLKKSKEALITLNKIIKQYPVPGNDYETFVRMNAYYVWIYIALKNYTLAEKYYQRLLPAAEKMLKYSWYRRNQYRPAVSLYLVTRQYDLVRKNLKAYDDFCNVRGSRSEIANNHLSWFKVDSAEGHYVSAIRHFQAYQAIRDSLFDEKKSKQIANVQVAFKTSQKEDSLKLQEQNIQILTQQSQLQQQEISGATLARNTTVVGFILLFLFFVVVYNRYRLKKRSNRLLQAQQEVLQKQQKEITQKNTSLQHLVEEKEWLLKEVHHRVKNNLQTVVSLLELQSENLRDEALSAIHDSQNRIYAMSLIHQKLYQTDNIASIDMQPYLQELTNHLQAIYNPDRKINFDLQVAPLELDVSQAIPVGLIVNEAVTNAIKYAFNYPAHHPQISIMLNQPKKQRITLTVADNGIGLPPGFNSADATGLGFKLMNGLVDDIEGKLMVESEEGTLIRVVFNASVPFDEKVQIPEPKKVSAV